MWIVSRLLRDTGPNPAHEFTGSFTGDMELLHRSVYVFQATSEQMAFAHFAGGRASLVCGTHTHIPAAD